MWGIYLQSCSSRSFSGIGASIGELTGYLAGYGGSAVIEENSKYKRIAKWMNKNGFITILVLATIPNPIFDLSGIFAGATHYSLKILSCSLNG